MNRVIKRILMLIFTIAITTSLVACKKTEDKVESPNLYKAVIYADFSNGSVDSEDKEIIKEDVIEMNEQPTIEDLSNALTQWSGLDFKLKEFRIEDKNAYVDWDTNSTLVAGLDDRKQKDEFHFYDSISLNWFMMDSLARTIKENFSVEEVYYSQGGGNPLSFEEGQGIGLDELPVEQSYEGSTFFVNHSGGKGNESIPSQSDKTQNDINEPNQGDPGNTNDLEWWGVWTGYEFSIEIKEFDGKKFEFEIMNLKNSDVVMSGDAKIYPDNDYMAEYGEVSFSLYKDFSAIDIFAPESSEWNYLRGQYKMLDSTDPYGLNN